MTTPEFEYILAAILTFRGNGGVTEAITLYNAYVWKEDYSSMLSIIMFPRVILNSWLIATTMSRIHSRASFRDSCFDSSFSQFKTSFGPAAQWSRLSLTEYSKQKARNVGSRVDATRCMRNSPLTSVSSHNFPHSERALLAFWQFVRHAGFL